MKYVVVTGGSVSGLGKGTSASSIGVVLRTQGYRVTAIKIDPYLNVDAGTISPMEHGEVFVLNDGHEGDLDLGNYERSLNICLTRNHNITTGKVYQTVISKERKGDFLGCTVQVVPHVTDCIQGWILDVAKVSVDLCPLVEPDICLIEVGGTVGDIESSVYLEALQQLFGKIPRTDYCLVHLSFLPTIGEEQKTKPSQHSFRFLREAGLKPDFVFARCQKPLQDSSRAKLALFSQIPPSHVISVHDVESAYLMPTLFVKQDLHKLVLGALGLPLMNPAPLIRFQTTPLELWEEMAKRHLDCSRDRPSIKIGIVAKYLGSNDTYLSLVKAIEHSGAECNTKVVVDWIDAEYLTPPASTPLARAQHKIYWNKLKACDGLITPGGFGDRGVEGKIVASKFAREGKIPHLGICYGLHTMVIEAAQNLLGLEDANTEEIDRHTANKVVVYMPETINKAFGGTMRLGSRATTIVDKDSLVYKLYDKNEIIHERHRHRYEVNVEYVPRLESVGYRFVGKDETGERMEIVEYQPHPFFMGVQFHPEFTSNALRPNPCILGLVLASAKNLNSRLSRTGHMLKAGSGHWNTKSSNDEIDKENH